MYKTYIYLEVRVLLSAVPGVFLTESESSGKHDILTAKAEFLKRNNGGAKVLSVAVQPSVLHKAVSFVRAVGGTVEEKVFLEHLTGKVQEPPDDRNFTGFSVKVGHGGSLDIMFHQKPKKITFEEVRIEENAGHLVRSSGKNGGKAHMDWTFAGCPSMRIRTSAVFELGEEAELFLNELYTTLSYLKLVTGDLDEGSIRCNAYVCISDESGLGEGDLEGLVKLRNLNSFNFVRDAVNAELSRQEEILSAGGKITSESRLWIAESKMSQTWQNRESFVNQFKMVEPLVQVMLIHQAGSGTSVPIELPSARRSRFMKQYGLSRLRARFLCSKKDIADYFEEAVQAGAEPLLTSHWMAGELMKLLNQKKSGINAGQLNAQRFASIMKMLGEGKIHSGIAKSLMQETFSTGEEPEEIVKSKNLTLLSEEEEILPFVKEALEEDQKSAAALKNGDMAPLDRITGLVMKKTEGRAVPAKVKSIIKSYLKISVVYILTMGGSISAKKDSSGTIVPGDAKVIRELLETSDKEPVIVTPVRSMLSEETEPGDWAALVAAIKERMESGTANGIVVTHGTDTLPYTAALLFWLFASSSVPVVLTASVSLPQDSVEARENIALAVKTARSKKNGVYVAFGGTLYSPLNLKFVGSGKKDSSGSNKGGIFANWNMDLPKFYANCQTSRIFETVSLPESSIMTRLFNEAAFRLAVVRLYPGLTCCRLEKMINGTDGADTIILELYASGTGNMKGGDYSLKPLLLSGHKKGKKFYCTSQQENSVDFSSYSTSAEVWSKGAVPMGALTTESTVALYFASYLIADNDDELAELMEGGAEVL